MLEVYKTSLYINNNPQDSSVFVEVIQVFNKGNSNQTQNLTIKEAIPLRWTMYSYSQQSRCFWYRYNIAWPCPDLNQADHSCMLCYPIHTVLMKLWGHIQQDQILMQHSLVDSFTLNDLQLSKNLSDLTLNLYTVFRFVIVNIQRCFVNNL